jgi:outer membrane protein OmpA-like peptidoglycan-associated protein
MNKTTAFIFFGIILVGLAISLYTLKGCGEKASGPAASLAGPPATPAKGDPAPSETAAAPAAGKAAPETSAPAMAGTTQPAPPKAPEAKKPDPSAPSPAGAPFFKSSEAAMAALTETIRAKDFANFSKLVGPGGIPGGDRDAVKALVEGSDLRLDPGKPQVEVSKSTDGLRWAFNFVPVAGNAEKRQLYVDLKSMPDATVDVAKVSLPLELAATRGAPAPSDAAAPSAAATAPMSAAAASDALTVAHAFSKAVIRKDYKTARQLADPSTVTDERVAALMIAVEEGKFALKEDRPLVVTLSRDDITWVLARVQSASTASEFAVELGKIDSAWKVNGLTFSKVLSALSEAAGGGDVAYSPIVEDPEGGDSLVLYFEFDQAGLTQRAQKQLAIVADILSQGSERVIRINGHADALGSADYNVGLSDRRAEAIRQALVGMGVKPEQVVTEAFGAAKPRKPNFLPDGSDNPSGRSQNRRAEVLLDF